MTELTEKELDFLDKQNVSLKEVCNISGMKTKEYKVFMKDNDYLIGYGGTPCKKEGHTLRLRHGHCAQCNTQGIAITQRKSMDGFLYVAISFSTGLVKVGVSTDFSKRELKLNAQKYGSIKDWNIVFVCEGKDIGDKENRIHNEFIDYRVKKGFEKEGKTVEAQEIFKIQVFKVLTLIENFDLECVKLDITEIERFDSIFSESSKNAGLYNPHLKDIKENAIANMPQCTQEKQISADSGKRARSSNTNKMKSKSVSKPIYGQNDQVIETTIVQDDKIEEVPTRSTDKSDHFANSENPDNSNNFDYSTYSDSSAHGKSLEEREAELKMFLPSNAKQKLEALNKNTRQVNSDKINNNQLTFLQEVYIKAISCIVILIFLALLYLFIA